MGQVIVEGLEVHAHHGLFPEEQEVGRTFVIDLNVESDLSRAKESDDIEGTINYARLCEIVHEQMAINSKLIEHVAKRIIDAIEKEFEAALSVEIKITKLNPPIPGKVKGVGVIMHEDFRWERNC